MVNPYVGLIDRYGEIEMMRMKKNTAETFKPGAKR
jgi:hypothetical protein